MDAIIAQIQDLAKTADEAGRKKLIDALRNLRYAIETPYDILQRFAGLVSKFDQLNCYAGGTLISYFRSTFKSRPLALALTWASSRLSMRARSPSVSRPCPRRLVPLQNSWV